MYATHAELVLETSHPSLFTAVDPVGNPDGVEEDGHAVLGSFPVAYLRIGQSAVESPVSRVAHVVDRGATLLGLETHLLFVHAQAIPVQQVLPAVEAVGCSGIEFVGAVRGHVSRAP